MNHNEAGFNGANTGLSRLVGVVLGVFGMFVAAAAQADFYITGVAQGSDGAFGYSGFHFSGEDGSSSNPRDSDGDEMTGSGLGQINAGAAYAPAPAYIGAYDDDTGGFYVNLKMDTGEHFTVTGNLTFSTTTGLLVSATSVAVDFAGSAPSGLGDTTISLAPSAVCCGGATAPPNSLLPFGGVPVISLWGADGSTIGLDLRLNMIAVQGDVEIVPLPAAAWLFGSALLGLFGVARRKQA